MNLIKKLILSLALSVSTFAHSVQHVDKAYLDNVAVNVSSSEQNALLVQGRKITSVIPSIPDALDYEADTSQGVLYFKLAPWYANRTVSAFVNDDQGARYKIIMRPTASLGAEEIILLPPPAKDSEGIQKGNQSFIQQIKELIYVMGDDADDPQDELAITGISRSFINQQIPLWQEAKMLFAARYETDAMYGELYKVTNITNSNLTLLEQEFYRKKVVAVSIEHLNLLPGQTTNVYVVRER